MTATEPPRPVSAFGAALPAPAADEDTQEFWDACRNHRLVVQQCRACGAFRFAPAPICYACRSTEVDWVRSDGIGEVYTWTVTHRSALPATAELVPYNSVVVKLADCGGAMITSNLVGIDDAEIRAGMRVEVVWDEVSPDVVLPRFRPLPDPGAHDGVSEGRADQ
jgi:uncharacterized OB-fold protein